MTSRGPTASIDRQLRTCFAAVSRGAAALVALRRSTEANAVPKRALALGFVSVIAFASSAAVSVGARTAGQLDPSFGTRGVVRTDFEVRGSRVGARAVAIDSRGRIVAAGPYAVARFTRRGSLDRSFSGDGKRTIGIRVSSVAIDSQDRIVVAGSRGPIDDPDFAVARLTTTGSLDDTFGSNGKVTTGFGPGNQDYANSVVIDSEGRIVVAGATAATDHYDFALARYLPNGSLDDSFDGDGLQTTDLGGLGASAHAVAIDARGRIVAAGERDVVIGGSGYGRFALARYTADGSLDPGFSGDGVVTTDFPGPKDSDGVNSVAIDANDRPIAAGAVGSFNCDGCRDRVHFALARFTPSGDLDPTFGTAGRVTTHFGRNSETATAVVIDSRGRCIAVGISSDQVPHSSPTASHFALARYRQDGSLDPSFSGDGKVTRPYGRARAATIDRRDRVVVGGSGLGRLTVARYLGD